ncbi:competence/damage-inducible protein A [Christensenella intestinihominis]|uniref:competence/damage-inducible protein A n=1 Tax=Christensenella intestinihominis TaxID=1851429 RepID=UPI00082E37AF|nr:competence/damage-inducible protein A [Christensenella intestinihominis]
MKAEILCVGTELLLGDIINTNAAYIAKELAAIGIDVYYQTVVGDNDGRLKDSLALAFSRADVVVMTGGLGPTYDDLTKETVADYFHRKMVMDEASLQSIEGFFNRLKRPMTENNKKQALMPEGAVIFPNSNGTAPGLAVSENGKTAILLPGPPSEMQPMFQQAVLPYLMGFSDKVLVSHNVRVFGMGESRVEDALYDLMKNSTNPTIAPYAKEGEVTLRVTAAADTKEKCEEMIAPVIGQIREVLGKYIYGIDVPNLQTAAVTELIRKKITIATAESCTGGLVSERITQVPGASEIFGCGVCSYANEIKHRVLGVSEETLAKYGAVSEQTAQEMAHGVRTLAGADIGISTTGIAGPGGGTPEKPVGLVYVGIDSDRLTTVLKLNINYHKADERTYIRHMTAQNVFKLVLKALENY